jgi:hypothetical protein
MKLPKRMSPKRLARRIGGRLNGGRSRIAAAAGVVAAAAAGVAAARLLKHRAGATVLHVQADSENGWVVTRDGSEQPLDRHPHRRQAVSAARDFAREHSPAVVNIHGTDGSVVRTQAFGRN